MCPRLWTQCQSSGVAFVSPWFVKMGSGKYYCFEKLSSRFKPLRNVRYPPAGTQLRVVEVAFAIRANANEQTYSEGIQYEHSQVDVQLGSSAV
jgi:hypothetical protein